MYMSPEQMESPRDVDERTDIWGFGVILYELLTGGPAFNGPTMAQVCASIMHGTPRSMRELRPELSPELESVVLRCLAKSPAMRFSDVGELALAMLPFAPRRSHASVKRIVAVVQSAGIARSALSVPPALESAPMLGQPMGVLPSTQGAWGSVNTEPPPSAPRRTNTPAIVAAIAFMLVSGLAVGLYATRGSTTAAPAAPASATESPTTAPAADTATTAPTSDGLTPPAATTSAAAEPTTAPSASAAARAGTKTKSGTKAGRSGAGATTAAPKIDPGVLDER
jgi:serine/threonine-protein kinase